MNSSRTLPPPVTIATPYEGYYSVASPLTTSPVVWDGKRFQLEYLLAVQSGAFTAAVWTRYFLMATCETDVSDHAETHLCVMTFFLSEKDVPLSC